MKDIRIFVASSKELEKERNYLAFLVLAHEDDFAKRGFRVRLSKWEYVDPTMTEARTEDRYLDEMLNCDAVLMMFRHVLGMYTKEEVDKAIAAEVTGVSRIKKHLMLFKEGDVEPSAELADWRSTLQEGTYGTFTSFDELKDHFLQLVEELSGLPLEDVAQNESTRTVSAFLAVDDELAVDRNAFADAVLNLNDVLVRRGARVRLRFYDPEKHRELLESSEMALVLYHTKCGDFGEKALDESYGRSKRDENPKRLYVFFRDADGQPLDGGFKVFKDGFADKFGSVPCRFENVDTLSLNFLFSLESVLGDDGGTFVKLDGRTVVADGLEVGDFTKLPLLEKNDGIAALFSRMQDVSKRFIEQRGKCEVDPQNDGLYVELLDISAEKNRLQDQIDRELKMSFNLAKRMAAVSIAQTNETIARARAKIEEGKINEALEILDGASVAMKRRLLLHRAAERAEAEELQIKELKANVEIEYFRVDAIMAYTAMLFDERFRKAADIYKLIVDDVESFSEMCTSKHKQVLDCMLADAMLKFAKHYAKTDAKAAMELYAKAWKVLESLPYGRRHIVHIRIAMAELCIEEEKNDLAMNILHDAKKECETVVKRNTFMFAVCMSRILNGLAKVYVREGKSSEAIDASGKALKIMEKVRLQSGVRFEERYVEALLIHGLSCVVSGKFEQALKMYEKGLESSRRIGFHSGVGAASNEIGELYLKENNFHKARKYYVDALLECKSLWLDNPPLYSKIARSLAEGLGKTFMSEDFSDDVCNIFGNILTGASAGFARNLLQRVNLLGHMYLMSGWLAGAQKIFDFSYLKSCELVKNCSTEFELEISSALRHLMDVNMRMNEFEKAFQAGDESLRLRRKWDHGSLWIVSLVKRLAKIKRTLGDIKQAEELLVESRRLEESLTIKSTGEHIHSEIAIGKSTE